MSVLAEARGQGLVLWVDGGALRYRAPAGRMTPERLAWLRTHKAAILAELSQVPTQLDATDRELAEAIRAMAQRWGYAPDELAEALTRAAVDPEGWRRLVAADLESRRWPGGGGWH